MKDKLKSPLAHLIAVECAKRGWNWSDVARLATEKTGRKGSLVATRNTLLMRVDRYAPTLDTYELFATIFGWTTAELMKKVAETTSEALAVDAPVFPEVQYTMPSPTVVTYWKPN